MGIDLSKFYQDNNFKKDGKLFYGVYRNRVLAIIEKGNYLKATISFNQQLTRELGQVISNKISMLKVENRALQRGLTTNINIELYFYQSADLQYEFLNILDKAYNILDENGLSTCEICPLCGQNMSSDSPFLKIKDSVIQSHNRCVEQLLSTTSQLEKGMYKNDKKTTIKALICNVLLMLTIVAIVIGLSISGIYGFVSIISGWLFLFVIKLVLMKAKVPVNLKYLIISIIFAFITSLLTITFGTIFDIYANNEFTLSEIFKNILTMVTLDDYALAKYMLTDLFLSILFIGINSFFDVKRLLDNKKNIKKL